MNRFEIIQILKEKKSYEVLKLTNGSFKISELKAFNENIAAINIAMMNVSKFAARENETV